MFVVLSNHVRLVKICIFYFLLMIIVKKTWVYFLKQNSKVFNYFKKFKALVEKENGYSIKSLKTIESECCSNDFNEFYEYYGIKKLLTMPRSPQQNDMVERKNRSFLNMAKSMLKTKKMPKEFWVEAVDCAIYLSNRCPTKGLNGMTPQEA